MKLYVWNPCLNDYTCGMAFAIAESAKDARAAIVEDIGFEPGFGRDDLPVKPTYVYDLTATVAYHGYGGSGR